MQGSYKGAAAPNDDPWRPTSLHWKRSLESRFEQGKDDFIENIDDVCIHYDGGRVAANESLIAEINTRGLRKTTKQTGLDRKTMRRILNGKKVKASTLAKIVMGLREELT